MMCVWPVVAELYAPLQAMLEQGAYATFNDYETARRKVSTSL